MEFLTEDQLSTLSNEEKVEYLELLKKLDRSKKYNKLHYFTPYEFQKKFYDKGKDNRVRGLIAANRVGKTYSAAMEVAMHLTGLYPDWWEGRVFDHPIKVVVSAVTAGQCRDVLQKELLGTENRDIVEDIGTGTIPRSYLDLESSMKARDGAYSELYVKHKSGGRSSVKFFAQSQGFEPMQGFTADIVLIDEQTTDEVFSELVKRTATVKGMTLITFTPLQGVTHLVKQFWDVEGAFHSGLVNAGWDDVDHIDDEAKEIMLGSTPAHLVDAVTKGIPVLGAGAVFNVDEKDIVYYDVEIQDHWPHLAAIDIGFTNDPTAAIFIAKDPSTGIYYIYDEYGGLDNNVLSPSDHAPHLFRKQCNIIPVAYDSAASARTGASGASVADMYREMGLNLLPDSFKNPKVLKQPNSSYKAILPGLVKMQEMMISGKLKIHGKCSNFWREFRTYSYDDKGEPSKKDNHWMDASRYAVMSILQDLGQPLQDNYYQFGVSEDDDWNNY